MKMLEWSQVFSPLFINFLFLQTTKVVYETMKIHAWSQSFEHSIFNFLRSQTSLQKVG